MGLGDIFAHAGIRVVNEGIKAYGEAEKAERAKKAEERNRQTESCIEGTVPGECKREWVNPDAKPLTSVPSAAAPVAPAAIGGTAPLPPATPTPRSEPLGREASAPVVAPAPAPIKLPSTPSADSQSPQGSLDTFTTFHTDQSHDRDGLLNCVSSFLKGNTITRHEIETSVHVRDHVVENTANSLEVSYKVFPDPKTGIRTGKTIEHRFQLNFATDGTLDFVKIITPSKTYELPRPNDDRRAEAAAKVEAGKNFDFDNARKHLP